MSVARRALPGFLGFSLACSNAIEPGAGNTGAGTPTSASSSSSGSAGGAGSTTDSTTASAEATGAGGTGGVTIPEAEVLLGEFTRLTRAEYQNTVESALAQTASVNLLPEDGRVGPFTSNLEVIPDPVHPYLLAAEELAAATVGGSLPACDAAELDACFDEAYRPALEALFRRPLNDSELATWSSVVSQVLDAGGTASEASSALVAAALLSPDFLYRGSPSSGGSNATLRRLGERMSYALWDAPPDAELRDSLSDASSLVEQSARLAADARATLVLSRFIGQWLGVDTDFRGEDPEFADSPDFLELSRFVRDAVQADLPVLDFIAGTQGFVHPDNAEVYGVDDGGTDDVAEVTWPPDSGRRGLLSQELFASSTRHPDTSRRRIFRGLLVRESLLCEEIPPPSADLVALADEVGERTEDARCSGCHLHIDPIGRVFASYDPDFEGTVEPAEILSHEELQGTYADAAELLVAISESRAFAECFSRHWLSFFLEQPLESADDAFVTLLADAVQAGAGLTTLVQTTASEIYARSETLAAWCEGQ